MSRHGWLTLLVVLAGCGSHQTRPRFTLEAPPAVRVGLQVGVAETAIRCTGSFSLSDGKGVIAALPEGAVLVAHMSGDLITIEHEGRSLAEGSGPFRLTSNNKKDRFVLHEKSYPGYLSIRRHSLHGFNLINVVDMETYLRGVIPREIPSAGKYQQAARAQAVAARTYALNRLGQYPKEGFDVYAGVLDQVYGSIETRNPTADEAVLGTRGQILLYQGEPIEAKYSSTCGGKMAGIDESFFIKVPYLPSGKDKLGGKEACRNSKYYRWEEGWTGDALWTIFKKTVPEVLGKTLHGSYLKEIKITKRGKSGRAIQLKIKTDTDEYTITKTQIRRVLRRGGGEMLRSTSFNLDIDKHRGKISKVKAKGQGWGHGVGMCQWGAMEFSSVGKDYAAILRHYYPKTTLRRVY